MQQVITSIVYHSGQGHTKHTAEIPAEGVNKQTYQTGLETIYNLLFKLIS